ncbi:hypothetical protein E4U42_001762 [Claviceps africana]|uniref:Uncharacterized protein n=1 Tax=Claviceps africana TaxID=83212 RepID=A0A8K0NJ20_9HYPO|nr:hypothetical protein E4U42_001762 [Claviceps africana]
MAQDISGSSEYPFLTSAADDDFDLFSTVSWDIAPGVLPGYTSSDSWREWMPSNQFLLPDNGPIDPFTQIYMLYDDQSFPDAGLDCIDPRLLNLNQDMDQRTGDEYDNTCPASGRASFVRPVSPCMSDAEYLALLLSVPYPKLKTPFQYFKAYPPVKQNSRRKKVRPSGSRLRTRLDADHGAARARGSTPRSVINPRRQDDGRESAENGTGDHELPQQSIDHDGTPCAPEPPRQSVPSTESTPAASEQDEIVFPCPYTYEQLHASDEYARRAFRAPANTRVGSVAYTRAIRKVFPFYGTGITLKDKKGGYYTLDADGLPALHDRLLKADSEAGEPTRRKRKTVHQLQKPTAECDPRRWYDEWKYRPGPWPLDSTFVYLEDAQLAYREYSTEDIKLYLEQCPRRYMLWVQSEPSQSSHRRHNRNGKPMDEDSKCRWAGCPVKGRAVVGLYRVAFDEFPAQTSQGIKDPYKVAMLMHLWCFEQILDPLVYYKRRRLLPDTRTFATPSAEAGHAAWGAPEPDVENVGAAEMKNNFCSKLGDAQKPRAEWGPLKHAFYPWFRATEATETLPRVYEKSLCYSLTSWCVGHLPKCKTDQFDKRMQARGEKKTEEERNKHKEEDEARERSREERRTGLVEGRSADELPPESVAFSGTTFHVHMGSLAGYKRALDGREQERVRSNKRRRGTLVTESNDAQTQEAGIHGNVWPGGELEPSRPSKRRRMQAD